MNSNKKLTNGRIIAITGGPGLGKSTLVKKLANYYNGKAILEGEEADFPKRIIDDIKNNKRILELVLFFRNKTVRDYIEALKKREHGDIVFLDTYWLTNDVYIDEWLTDDFEKQLMHHVSQIDQHFLAPPDLTICLTAGEKIIRAFMKNRGRSFEREEKIISKYIAMTASHDAFFKQKRLPNTKFIDRTKLDFETEKDFKIITDIIDDYIQRR